MRLLSWFRVAVQALVAALVLGVLLAPVRAQVITADIVGTVTDSSGAVLPGARITVKDFKPTERTTLQFRAEMFNIVNHPNFGNPGNQLGTGTFGVISDTANALPRNIQLALKLLF